jgi:hypothetical protein
MPEEPTWSIGSARHLILGAWALYAVVWAVFLLPFAWAPAGKLLARGGLGAGILWIGTFIFALAIAFLGLSVGVVAGWSALRDRPNRTWLNVTLVAVSILGLLAQAFYIKFLLFGV